MAHQIRPRISPRRGILLFGPVLLDSSGVPAFQVKREARSKRRRFHRPQPGSRADLFIRDGRIEIEESLDIPAHDDFPRLLADGVSGVSLVVAYVLDHFGVGENLKLHRERPGLGSDRSPIGG